MFVRSVFEVAFCGVSSPNFRALSICGRLYLCEFSQCPCALRALSIWGRLLLCARLSRHTSGILIEASAYMPRGMRASRNPRKTL